MLADALQQSLLHALTQSLELLTGFSWLDYTHTPAQRLAPMTSTLSSIPSLQTGQPAPVMSWQTGPSGAQPLPFMSPTTGAQHRLLLHCLCDALFGFCAVCIARA